MSKLGLYALLLAIACAAIYLCFARPSGTNIDCAGAETNSSSSKLPPRFHGDFKNRFQPEIPSR